MENGEIESPNDDYAVSFLLLRLISSICLPPELSRAHMEPCILKKERSRGVNMKALVLNLVLFIYIMFSTTVASDPYAMAAF